MIKSELIGAISCRFPGLTNKDVEVSVRELLGALSKAMAKGDRVEIRGFGSFGLNYRPARTGRNPKSGKTVIIAPKYAPHFKAGKEMRERVEESARRSPAD